MNKLLSRQFSGLIRSAVNESTIVEPVASGILRKRDWNPIPIPHRTIPEPIGHDLDFVNVAHSHLIHCDWTKLGTLSSNLRTLKSKHVMLRIQKDDVLSQEFFEWVRSQNPCLLSLETTSIILHILTRARKFKSAEAILRTVNMVIRAYCKLGTLDKAAETFAEIKDVGFTPTVASYNTLITGYCKKGLTSPATKLKYLMGKNQLHPNEVTFNTLIDGFCKVGKLHQANQLFSEMRAMKVVPNAATYHILINGYSQEGISEMGYRLYEEMCLDQVKPDILTYSGLILGLRKAGKTKKAAFLVKDLEKKIIGQCVRKNLDRALKLYQTMVKCGFNPNGETFKMLISAFCDGNDFEGAFEVMMEMFGRSQAPDTEIIYRLCAETGKRIWWTPCARRWFRQGKNRHYGIENRVKEFV